MNKKTPSTKTRELRAKLQELAERGINGEQDAAKEKLARLEARYDFAGKDKSLPDLFAGRWKPGPYASPVFTFTDGDIANAVKWAIEQTTGIGCRYRGDLALWAEATPGTAKRLEKIAGTVAAQFSALWFQFAAKPGTHPGDRSLFIRGLYDGMLEDVATGEALPKRTSPPVRRARKNGPATTPAQTMTAHPYTLATKLGAGVRFKVPLESLQAELEAATTPAALPEKNQTPA